MTVVNLIVTVPFQKICSNLIIRDIRSPEIVCNIKQHLLIRSCHTETTAVYVLNITEAFDSLQYCVILSIDI